MTLSRPPSMEEIVNYDIEDLTNILETEDYYHHERSKEKVLPYLVKCDQHDDYAFHFFLQIILKERVHLISYYLFLYKKKEFIAQNVWIDIYFELTKSPDILKKIDETNITIDDANTEIIFQFDAHKNYWSTALWITTDNFVIDLVKPYRGIHRITFATSH